MLALLAVAALVGTKPTDEVVSAKAYISAEFAQHVRDFKANDPKTITRFWFKNCLAGFEQFDPDGTKHLYEEISDSFASHPANFEANSDRMMRLIKIEKVKAGFATLVEQGWTGVLRNAPDGAKVHGQMKVHSVVQQLWQKTRKGFGLKFSEVLFYHSVAPHSALNQICVSPHKIWDGKPPAVPEGLAGVFRKGAKLNTQDARRRRIPPRQM